MSERWRRTKMMLLVVLCGLSCECFPVVANVTSARPDTSATLQREGTDLVWRRLLQERAIP